MTDDEMFDAIQSIVNKAAIDDRCFKGNQATTATFAMGVCSANTYANFTEDLYPWSRVLQIGRLMQLLHDAPGPVCIAMALALMDRITAEPQHVKDNVINGIGHVMSDYAYRLFKSAMVGNECHTTRTYHILKHLLQIAEIRRLLTTPNMSIDLHSIHYSIGQANIARMPMRNEAVDAHPMAREMLRRYIEEVQRLIKSEIKDAA